MKSTNPLRLLLDLSTLSMLVAAFAYDLLGNALHELLGTTMISLVVVHNAFNRKWYRFIVKGWREPRTAMTKAVVLLLLATFIGLLATSLMISKTIFDFFPIRGGFSARQAHVMAAYAVLLIVALHVGSQWSKVLRIVAAFIRIPGESRLRTIICRAAATVVILTGLYGISVLNLPSKLLMEPSFDFWDFETATLSFFVYHGAVFGLVALTSFNFLKFIKFLASYHCRAD